eukprot:CAMPEP_0115126202 /NCGR_PEP_ID=MMETSP0227-20121206/49565_1 /TAXON_ID=89957 /ORGANISM="Polarella glacialis, Strain CCMP 1383" /LENGTH=114 /DNA_ID=CAMNT_0002529855 /DNA_START=212 /DNA_END=556 /DNA_ORIENTATION=+
MARAGSLATQRCSSARCWRTPVRLPPRLALGSADMGARLWRQPFWARQLRQAGPLSEPAWRNCLACASRSHPAAYAESSLPFGKQPRSSTPPCKRNIALQSLMHHKLSTAADST